MRTQEALNPSLREALSNGLDRLEGGQTMSIFSPISTPIFPKAEIEALLNEAERVRAYARRIKDWKHVKRTTLVPRGSSNSNLLLRTAASSNLWAPRTHRLAMQLATTVRELTSPTSIDNKFRLPTEGLETWEPNRIGFNYMNGTEKRPAIIKAHCDVPEERGLVVALSLSGQDAGCLSLIFGYDTCKALGYEQTEHEAETYEERIGVTIAELLPKTTPAN